jgi:hypothetical protein
LGLSPNSVRAFQNREESRFNCFSQDLLDEIDDIDENNNIQNKDEGEDDPWDCSDDEIDFLSPEEDYLSVEEFVGTRIPEDELIFQIDTVYIPSKTTSQPTNRMRMSNGSQRSSRRCSSIPFWYLSESPDHLAVIVQNYNHKILKDNSIRCDCRRLPQFIGRIHRSPVKEASKNGKPSFQTFDKIDVYQRDIRPCGSLLTKLSTAYVLSSWDSDGIPYNIEVLANEQISSWRRKIIKKSDSFIYCLPVWESRTEFKFCVESEEHEVGYAYQPWNYTAYLPPEFQKKNLDSEDIN